MDIEEALDLLGIKEERGKGRKKERRGEGEKEG